MERRHRGAALTVAFLGIGAMVVAPAQDAMADTPAISSAANATATVGSMLSFTVTTVGAPTPVLRVSGHVPKGVAFSDHHDGTGSLSGVPTATTRGVYPRPAGGMYSLTVHATFGSGATKVLVTQAFSLTLDQAPTIKARATRSVRAGAGFSIPFKTVGFPKPALSETGGLPAGASFTDNGNGSASLAGSIAVAGSYPLTITASNGVGAPATLDFLLVVRS